MSRLVPVVALLLAVLLVAGPASAWSITEIGNTDGGTSLDMDVGDGDRDGQDEVFVTTLSGFEVFRWTGSAWNRTTVGATEAGAIAVGDGDRNGKAEVYVGSFDGSLRRFAWTGTDWNRNKIATLPVSPEGLGIGHIALGDLENDGKVEVYASSGDGLVYKLWFDGGAWSKKKIADLASPTTELRIGDGDRDGMAEMYVGVSSGYVYEVEANGNQTWTTTLLGAVSNDSWVASMAIGHAKYADQQEVYVSDSNNQVFRFVWNLTTHTWFKQTIAWTDWFSTELTAHDFDGDGRSEVYSGSDGGRFYRFLWNGTAWTKTQLVVGDGTTVGIEAGDADRDGNVELYAANAYTDDPVYRIEP